MTTDSPTAKTELLPASEQFSTFFVADLFFGVDVLNVQEVLRFQPMTPVPQAPEVIEGLINLRGQIVTAIDMRRRLRLPTRAGDKSPMNMVVRTGRRRGQFAGRRNRRCARYGRFHLRTDA